MAESAFSASKQKCHTYTVWFLKLEKTQNAFALDINISYTNFTDKARDNFQSMEPMKLIPFSRVKLYHVENISKSASMAAAR